MLRFTKNKETLASELAVPDCFEQKKDHKSHEALVRAYVFSTLWACGYVVSTGNSVLSISQGTQEIL